MTTSSYHAAILPPRAFLRVTGPDRERFLNGQLTNDIRLATDDRAIFAALLDAKGKLEAICYVHTWDDGYLLDTALASAEALAARLDRYLVADDVSVNDETGRWHLMHLVAEDASSPPPSIEGARAFRATRIAAGGWDLLAENPIDLAAAGIPFPPDIDADAAERMRIAQGIPAWGKELVPGILPPDAGLDTFAISYEKGCYVGQEIISRMKRSGKTNLHLVQLSVPVDAVPGSILLHEGTEAGTVTSVAPAITADRQATLALGYLKRKFGEIAEFHLAAPDGSPAPGTASVKMRLVP